jgi:hypothetical protein
VQGKARGDVEGILRSRYPGTEDGLCLVVGRQGILALGFS